MDNAIETARNLARAFGQEAQLDRLARALELRDLFLLDTLLDELQPGTGGFHDSFLPSFAVAATAPLMRSRRSWRDLRDRVFANAEKMEARLRAIDSEKYAPMFQAFLDQHAPFSRENDPPDHIN
jgi:broad specificity phosphatase PhoE